MGTAMNAQEFEQMCMILVKQLRWYAPNPETREEGKSTGNLAFHGVDFEWIDQSTCKIFINEDQAPYMPFTNEPWISPRWNGKKNPNEKWFDKSALKLAQLAAKISKGELQEHD